MRIPATLLVRVLFLLWLSASGVFAQVMPDLKANVSVSNPAFARDTGPKVVFDAGHYNYHKSHERFAPFAALLQNDGFRVSDKEGHLNTAYFLGIDVLVIANALNSVNDGHWAQPVPSAFDEAEIDALKTWVENGGALLLIADHFPFAGAAAQMAAAFGFHFINGFVFHTPLVDTSDIFTTDSGALHDHPIIRGRTDADSVSTIATFTGSAFTAPPSATPLIVLPKDYVVLLPDVAWEFNNNTPRIPAEGYLQGAAMRVGNGRILVFGEAGMFTAQVSAANPDLRTGFNAPEAAENKKLILNALRWLSGHLP